MEINNYKVSKGIHFCYGHRVLEYNGMCRYLHGHNAYLEIDISSNRLDQLGMVVDFNEIKDKAKNWIDQHVDHKMLLCDGDPIIPALKELGEPYFLMAENPLDYFARFYRLKTFISIHQNGYAQLNIVSVSSSMFLTKILPNTTFSKI